MDWDIPKSRTDEELYEAAKTVVLRDQRASTSHLQRQLKIGYNQANRLMGMLEEAGMVRPPPELSD